MHTVNPPMVKRNDSKRGPRLSWWAAPVACLSTLLAIPVNAGIIIPDDPLTSAIRVAPNVMFILDDSGSMLDQFMPDYAPDTVPSNNRGSTLGEWFDRPFYGRNPAFNSLAYDSSKDYKAWMQADGGRRAGGDDFTKAYSNDSLVAPESTATAHLARLSRSVRRTDGNTSRTTEYGIIFYVPKPGKTKDSTNATDYYQYQYYLTGGTANGALVARRCEEATATSGAFDNSCTNTGVLPPYRTTWEAELKNYAIWYSYHRTRMKAAKAGASEAFASQGEKLRVGFRTIWGRNSFDIPVQDGNDGRFVDSKDDPGTPAKEPTTTSRTKWFTALHGAVGSNGTPLRKALADAGEYFKDRNASGPYGPESGDGQFSCRQNFSILTTDGYWNGDDGSAGNADNEAGIAITGPGGKSYTYSAVLPFKGGSSETLADVAMKYWKTDLTDMTNNVPTSDANPAFWQHMVTFGISIGLKGTLDQTSVKQVMNDGGPKKNGVLLSDWPRLLRTASTTSMICCMRRLMGVASSCPPPSPMSSSRR